MYKNEFKQWLIHTFYTHTLLKIDFPERNFYIDIKHIESMQIYQYHMRKQRDSNRQKLQKLLKNKNLQTIHSFHTKYVIRNIICM